MMEDINGHEIKIRHPLVVDEAIKLAVKYPKPAIKKLAQLFFDELSDLFDLKMSLHFCNMLWGNFEDGNTTKEVNPALLRLIKGKRLREAIGLLKSYPDEGLKVLVVLVTEELQENQKLKTIPEQTEFVVGFLDALEERIKREKTRELIVILEKIQQKNQTSN